eukprot:6190339-Pleurochrysis_carterae.AAC.1
MEEAAHCQRLMSADRQLTAHDSSCSAWDAVADETWKACKTMYGAQIEQLVEQYPVTRHVTWLLRADVFLDRVQRQKFKKYSISMPAVECSANLRSKLPIIHSGTTFTSKHRFETEDDRTSNRKQQFQTSGTVNQRIPLLGRYGRFAVPRTSKMSITRRSLTNRSQQTMAMPA